MKHDTPHILCVNPWIHDFAAYDFWARPLGLLSLASILRNHGFFVSYIDCLDRFHPKAVQTDPYVRYGRGPYLKTRIPKPKVIEDVPRNFSRYGIKPEWFREDLKALPDSDFGPDFGPDLVLITSFMTYWYPGVQETIKIVKETFPDVPVVLGGIYATLCSDHAVSHSGTDRVFTGSGEKTILKLAGDYTGFSISPKFDPDDLDTYPYPAFDLQQKIPYIPLLTSKGCPFSCAYCASGLLNPEKMLRNPELVVEEIRYWHEKYNVKDFIFYDDALLVDAERHAIPLFEEVCKTGFKVRFHTPNAVHIRGISKQIAGLMFKAGVTTLRLGLETAAFENRKEIDSKVTESEFMRAVSILKDAGFNKKQVGAYLLAGLPDQTLNSLAYSIKMVRQSGITPVMAYYSPIPNTALWNQSVVSSRYDLESEPVFTNNAIFPCQGESFSWEIISYLKNLAAIK